MMTADPLDACLKIICIDHILAKDQRRDEILQDMPGRAGGLIVVTRVTRRHTFAVAGQPFRPKSDQNTLPVGLAPKGGLERRDQRHGNMVEGDGFDFHGFLNGTFRRCYLEILYRCINLLED